MRSGKTLFMSLSFVLWAMSSYSGCRFGLCGKTIGSLRRNVVVTLLPMLRELGFECVQNQIVLTNSTAKVLKSNTKSTKFTVLNDFSPSRVNVFNRLSD